MSAVIEWQRAVKCEECHAVSDSTTFCARCGSMALWNIARILDDDVKILVPPEQTSYEC